MGRPKNMPTQVNSSDTPFRVAEKYWRARAVPPDLAKVFDVEQIRWNSLGDAVDGDGSVRVRGFWTGEGGERRIECWKVPLCEIGDTGLGTPWKGKGKEEVGEKAFAIIVPAIPGLVLIPRALPPQLQRQLTRVSLHSTAPPNNTSLTPHYATPPLGFWKTAVACSSSDPSTSEFAHLTRIDPDGIGARGPRIQVDFEGVNPSNWQDATMKDRKVEHHPEFAAMVVDTTKKEEIGDVLRRMRWVTIGWQYNWTSKTYRFDVDRPNPLPPLIYQCCKDLVASIPWPQLFGPNACTSSTATNEDGDVVVVEAEDEDWKTWSTTYEPEAGVVNFYHLTDSLTAHQDQSEVDGARPLVSFSIAHSAVFLVGGMTREIVPVPILLRSGDGLIMSGRDGRRVFHGLPRVLADTLPSYLHSTRSDDDHEQEADVDGEQDDIEWSSYGEYLEGGARLNINVRQVFR